MSEGWWRDAPAARPVRVDGGVRAKSRRGVIGEQWWSRRFLGVLESFGMSGRLARGRNYARAGQVLEFTLGPGKVDAAVQGSRVRPYSVRIGVRKLTAAQWRRVAERLAGQAIFRAKLLAGEMPHEIEEVFSDCGTPLFPDDLDDLEMDCSCPDWGMPCKHMAAVCYVLAEAFDADPFAMLAWRGKGREELLTALRAAGPAVTGGGAGSGAGPAAPGQTPSIPLAECLDRFWAGGLSAARLRALAPPAPAATPDLLLRLFEPPPVQVRGSDLAEVLASAYQRLADADLTAPGG